MNILNELKKLGVEITDDISNKFKGEFISEQESEKKYNKLKDEKEDWKDRAEKAESTLNGFDGKDLEAITKERDEWKKKAEQAEQDYAAKEAKRAKDELLGKAFEGVEFTSESAKKAIYAQIAEGVTVKDGKLIGFNDLLNAAKESDAGAFVDKEQQNLEQNKAKFTKSMNNSGGSDSKVTRESILSIKDREERQKAISENIELFR